MRLALLLSVLLLCARVSLAGPCNCETTDAAIDAVCEASGAVSFCDDFEDGTWVVDDTGTSNAANDSWAVQLGYCASINEYPYADSSLSGGGGPIGTYSATSGLMVNNNGCDARVALASNLTEIYMRVYMRWQSNHNISDAAPGEKIFIIRQTGDIQNILLNVKDDRTLLFHSQIPGSDGTWDTGMNALANGHWYYFELRLKCDTNGSDGIAQVWHADCGLTGRDCDGTQPSTPDFSLTDRDFTCNSAGRKFIHIFKEAYANDFATDGEELFDNIALSTSRIYPLAAGGSTPGSQGSGSFTLTDLWPMWQEYVSDRLAR